MERVYISLGSNIGNRIRHLQVAYARLSCCCQVLKTSIVLETHAIVPANTPPFWNTPFLNMVLCVETRLSPQVFLRHLKSIESTMGRSLDAEKWAPRVIDLDILLWEGVACNTAELSIPHPELKNRDFLQHLLGLMGVAPFTQHDYGAPFLKSFVLFPALVGIVNVTSDSFSDGGCFQAPEKAIARVHQLAQEGATVIEIGAQSTRPFATIQGPDQEYRILSGILEAIGPLIQEGVITVSVDSFWPFVVHQVLEQHPKVWINDVQGTLDEGTLRTIAAHNVPFCWMHSLGVPPTKEQILPLDKQPIQRIKAWGASIVERLVNLGFSLENIIIDPGIGFGKNAFQNIALLRQLQVLSDLGVSILVGHSRKSYMRSFSVREARDRDIETMGCSLAIQEKVDFLRVHNVADHMRSLVAFQSVADSHAPA